ncbi:hypothetical protein [Pelomonas cellulosilytica]|uniref:DUF3618 domain-containing protein n=1 Tax=Pelomonas cellulosilytica TaxID=2906762 RepID=A0ABS8XQT6_9BURK|nr:hypothetical protein [Pelomonas sp. P8]MCE4553108.1 hypothetical protein [Pelomonas sp. P8]
MNAPQSPLPASLSRVEGDDDIDAQIVRVEQRLIAREENLRRGVGRFGHELRDAFRPRRWLKPALAGAAGVALLWLLLRRRPAAASVAPVQAVARPALLALLAGLPWARLVDVIWPLLPERWRARMNPTTATQVLTVGLPVLGSLFGRQRRRDSHA